MAQSAEENLNFIAPSSSNPRIINDEYIAELASSIQNVGLKEPITLRSLDGFYEIIDGECRFRAFQKLGRKTIPCIIKQVSEEEADEERITVNLHRSPPYSFMEKCRGMNILSKRFSQQKIADIYNVDQTTISNYLTIMEKLNPNLLPKVEVGKPGILSTSKGLINEVQALEIVNWTDDHETQEKIVEWAIIAEWSTDELRKALNTYTPQEIKTRVVTEPFFIQLYKTKCLSQIINTIVENCTLKCKDCGHYKECKRLVRNYEKFVKGFEVFQVPIVFK